MKINTFLPALLSIGIVLTGFTACSDDDPKEPNTPDKPANGGSTIAEVFPEGLPAKIGNAAIKTDEKGRVTEIVSTYTEGSYTSSESVKFDYTPVSRATDYDMTMSYYYEGELDYIFYIQLNDKGFIKHALEVDANDPNDTDTWDFAYNEACQLNYLKRSENEDEVFMTYVNGDIVKVTEKDIEDGHTDVTDISYTNATVKTAIINKGGIMMFDDCFNIDMDEMDMAYYAGLLGKATKNLPVGYSEKDGSYTYGYDFHWKLNASGLPIKMTETYPGADPATSNDSIIFVW